MPSMPLVQSPCLEAAVTFLAGCARRAYRCVTVKAPDPNPVYSNPVYFCLNHNNRWVRVETEEGKRLAVECEDWVKQRERARRVANIGAGMALIAIGSFAWSTSRVAAGLVGALVCISVSELGKREVTRIFNDLIGGFASDIQRAERLR
jgi:hypothetical protein